MKKSILIFLAVLICFSSLCGCAAPKKTATYLFYSDNGYAVSYPSRFSPTALSLDIDFVIMDERTGSTVSIQTKEKEAASVTEEDFISQKKAAGIDIRIASFTKETVNDLPALVVMYSCNESNVTEIIYEGSESAYSAVYTELPGTSDSDRADMIAVIFSLTA